MSMSDRRSEALVRNGDIPDQPRDQKKAVDTSLRHAVHVSPDTAIFTDSFALSIFNNVLDKNKDRNEDKKPG